MQTFILYTFLVAVKDVLIDLGISGISGLQVSICILVLSKFLRGKWKFSRDAIGKSSQCYLPTPSTLDIDNI